MLKGLTISFFTVCFLFFAGILPLNALEISKFEKETDGEATITFCQTFTIKNVALDNNLVAPTVILPKEDDIYENLTLLNPAITTKIIAFFEGVGEVQNSCKKADYSLISARKVKDKNLVVAKVSFDKDMSATFLVSTYKKKNKTLYRVKIPQDFNFLSRKYKNKFRIWLVAKVKNLL